MNKSRRVVELYLDDSEASREQREVIGKIRRRFPNLNVQEFGLQAPQAFERGIFLAPGLVIDDVILGLGRVVSPGKIRRFMEQSEGPDDE